MTTSVASTPSATVAPTIRLPRSTNRRRGTPSGCGPAENVASAPTSWFGRCYFRRAGRQRIPLETDSEIRVLLAEDHALFRQGLRELLSTAGLNVIGEASDGVTAVRLARELRPDVVVMDLNMPRMDGIDATSEIMKAERPPVVLVLTVSTTNDDVLDAIAAGASGYLLKDADADEIVN